ncbi:MAG: ATP-binding cassette domain-containing protein [Aquincola sp.]|nr:ATP-binding cassette domain-containing protein [Aquincola sp.]
MARVSLSKIEKVYPNGFKAVHGVNLDIHDGEFMVFVGPSGCAKSTLLRMVAGLESITGGELRIGEKLVNGLPAKERGIAMVFQNYALYPHMSVYNNMAFGLKMRKFDKAEIKRRVDNAADILGIKDHRAATTHPQDPQAKSGYVRQDYTVSIVERAGFRFWKPLVWDKRTIGMGYHYRARYEFTHDRCGGADLTHNHLLRDTNRDRRQILFQIHQPTRFGCAHVVQRTFSRHHGAAQSGVFRLFALRAPFAQSAQVRVIEFSLTCLNQRQFSCAVSVVDDIAGSTVKLGRKRHRYGWHSGAHRLRLPRARRSERGNHPRRDSRASRFREQRLK